jgi:uncharacterized protein Yka (UPF0111/DUF47 family)
MASPFDGLLNHAKKVKECAWVFQQAIECHISSKCKTFEEFRQEVVKLESEADFLLVDTVIDPVKDLSKMVFKARKFFKRFSEKQRVKVKNIARNLSRQEHEADKVEGMIKEKVLNMKTDPVTVFHLFRLAIIIGSIADHAENAGDMMRAMVAR